LVQVLGVYDFLLAKGRMKIHSIDRCTCRTCL